jgi:hypothetical protein
VLTNQEAAPGSRPEGGLTGDGRPKAKLRSLGSSWMYSILSLLAEGFDQSAYIAAAIAAFLALTSDTLQQYIPTIWVIAIALAGLVLAGAATSYKLIQPKLGSTAFTFCFVMMVVSTIMGGLQSLSESEHSTIKRNTERILENEEKRGNKLSSGTNDSNDSWPTPPAGALRL